MSIEARFRVDYPGFRLDVDMTLPSQGVTALFGPSGSGKTTLLRCIAGLEAADGRLAVNGELWQDGAGRGVRRWPTHQRPIGYVFQEASLFPHLSAEQNMRFGLRRSAPVTPARVGQIVDLLGIGHLLTRLPGGLSGGERQRVAIARALLSSPKLLLMDEPLAALDLKRKQEILPYLERLHRELDIPVVYVSHSPDEVARLADHLVVLDQGRVVAQGALAETLGRIDLPPAFADDAGVVIEGWLAESSAEDQADGLSRLDFAGGAIWISAHAEAPGTRLRCRIHARDVSLSRDTVASSILNRFEGTITGFAGTTNPAHVLVRLEVSGTPLLARITRRSLRLLGLVEGERVIAQVKAVALLG